MEAQDLKERTKHFAIRIVRLYQALSRHGEAGVIGKQLLRAGTSVGANYRSVCRARSRADFVSKIAIAIEESDETLFWLEVILEVGIVPENRLLDIMKEADELVAILVVSRATAMKKMRE
jgi:four helix bundle protein